MPLVPVKPTVANFGCMLTLDMVPINPFPANDALRCHETFSFMMLHPAMSLGDRFCDSRKGGRGGGGWVRCVAHVMS